MKFDPVEVVELLYIDGLNTPLRIEAKYFSPFNLYTDIIFLYNSACI